MSGRVIVLWLPDWPVQAARLAEGEIANDPAEATAVPMAVVADNQVIACNAAARRGGVGRGQRRRHAQARCPSLQVFAADPVRDAQFFEPVLAAVENVSAGVEALRPGLIAVSAGPPTRYYGGEGKALEMLIDATALTATDSFSGIADDLVTAVLAARRGVVVPEGASGTFLSGITLREVAAEETLEFPEELVRTWDQLGLRTLGDVAALPGRDVASRFGVEGARWHGLARGDGERRVSPRGVPRDLAVHHRPEEPITRVDVAAFLARSLAAEAHSRLYDASLTSTRLSISVTMDDGAEMTRIWRCAGPLTEAATADRVRWQLDGWLSARAIAGDGPDEDSEDAEPGRGIVEIVLEPLDAVPAGVIRDALWGGVDEASERAERVAVRIQGLLGTDAVQHLVAVGGRGPAERVLPLPVGEAAPDQPAGEWPGALPAPSPAVTYSVTAAEGHVELEDTSGHAVAVTGRGFVTGDPAVLVSPRGRFPVTGWAGPWPVDERWWSCGDAWRGARLQVSVDGRSGPEAYLLIGSAGRWRVEGTYR
ncbi:Y-family DNA polymerase [Corynebacterium sputi]|uniref:Y-family DNA polymerase n=1 Tax=Corynebacterium sputi TaxID=489915 RepID=UPI0004229C47|nr:DNA polymerase Y family protein [Corynebacterium sputi]